MKDILIRKGTIDDIEEVFDLVLELARFEKEEHQVLNSVDRMKEEGFSANPAFEFFVAESAEKIVGMALYYFSYSTWKGKSLYIDDLVVYPEYRRQGIGDQLMKKVLEIGKEENCGKVHWQVLDWNEPAINYYKKIGAEFDGAWINCAIPNCKL